MAANADEVYKELNAEDVDELRPMEIESLCVNCEENGTTRLLCTSIPYYKAVILMSFECPHCGCKNNEIQSGEAVQEHGTEIVLRVREQADLRRQLVKSEYASIEVPELELTIPSRSQPGEVTIVEGVLDRVRSGLNQDQEKRRLTDPENAQKIDEFVKRIDDCVALKTTWTLKLHDPSGNCFIQNPDPRHVDPRCIVSHYSRPADEIKMLGLADDQDQLDQPETAEWKSYEDAKQEVVHFHTNCPNCNAPTEVNMKPTDIPFFQTVIIMAQVCDKCGYKTTEVKSGGGIRPNGCKLILKLEKPEDLTRDVLKSDTCSLSIPELDLDVGYGALGGRFTTVEGLLIATKEQIDMQSSFFMGDSAVSEDKEKVKSFLDQLDKALALELPVTIVLDDPAGNSYVQSLSAPLDDPRLQKEFYERNWEQNEELGLNDMKVENYGELDAVTEEKEEDE